MRISFMPQAKLQILENEDNVARKWSEKRNRKLVRLHFSNLKEIQRLSRIPGWTMVVVGDTKTPKNWSLKGVHDLSVEDQQQLGGLVWSFVLGLWVTFHLMFDIVGYRILNYIPHNSYARKNIGYLYAIKNGAEWIYDMDDENTPYGVNKVEIFTLRLLRQKCSSGVTYLKCLRHRFSRFGKKIASYVKKSTDAFLYSSS